MLIKLFEILILQGVCTLIVSAQSHDTITTPPASITSVGLYPPYVTELIESYELEEVEGEDIDWEDHDALKKRWPSIPWWPWPWHWRKRTRTHTLTSTHTITYDYIVHGTETSESTSLEYLPDIILSIWEEWVTNYDTSVESDEVEQVSTRLVTETKQETLTSTEAHLEIATSLTTIESLYESTIVLSSAQESTVQNTYTRTTLLLTEVLTSSNQPTTVVSTKIITSDLDTVTYSVIQPVTTDNQNTDTSKIGPTSSNDIVAPSTDAVTSLQPTTTSEIEKITSLSESTVKTVISTEETRTLDYWITSKVLTSVELVETGVEETQTTFYTLVTSVSTSTSFETLTSLNTFTSYDVVESSYDEEEVQTDVSTTTVLSLLTLVKTVTSKLQRQSSYLTTHMSTKVYTIEKEHTITSHSFQTSIEVTEREEEYSVRESGPEESSTFAPKPSWVISIPTVSYTHLTLPTN